MQHLGYSWAACSGLDRTVQNYMMQIKDRFLELTQWVHIEGDVVFSHAGISKVWMENVGLDDVNKINDLPPSEIFGFNGKMSDYTGESSTQPPTWIRPHTLVDCGYKGVIHVVGHTNVGPLRNYKDEYVKSGQYSQQELDELVDVWCCDRLPMEYLIIENNKFIVKKWA
jgi:hypothetical protein